MVGDSFGGYSILSRLGQGRSGTVYRARRHSDGRRFCLKIIHPEVISDGADRAGLLAAARKAARLSHPAIAPIVEVLDQPGAVGIVSDLAEGRTLSDRLLAGPLAGPEVARIAAVVARAVAHAHEHGVAGLALDPANVLIDGKGRVIWTGLDSMTGGVDSPRAHQRLEDVGALGCLLRRIARDVPDLPDEVKTILEACDASGPEGSYRRAADLAEDLEASIAPTGVAWPRWLAAATTIVIPVVCVLALGRAGGVKEPLPGVIAVLPFETLAEDPGEFYLGAGLADAITTRLSRSHALVVSPMSSVMEAIQDRPSPEVVASRLGAGAILQGTCRRTAGVIRARVRLVNAITGTQIWQREFQPGANGHGPIEEEIVSQTLGSLAPGSAEREDGTQTAESGDLQMARYLYLLARGRMADHESRPLREAVHLLERATTTDPSFEPAYTALAQACTNMLLGGLSSDRMWLARGIAAGRQAVSLDPDDPEGHYSLGYALLYSGEPVQAVREVLAALRIDRAHTSSLGLMSALLSQAGAARPARRLRDKAARLDPSLAPGWGEVYLAAVEGRMAETVDRLEQDIDSRRAAGQRTEIRVQTLGFLAFETGDPTAGLRWAAMLEELSDNAVYSDLVRLLAFARMSDARAVRSILERGRTAYWENWEYSLWIARALALVGERQESLVWLTRCAELGGYDASALKRGDFFSSLGNDPVYRKAEFEVTTRARQIVDLAASEGYL